MTGPKTHNDANFANLHLHPKLNWLPFVWNRPLGLLPNNTIVAVDGYDTHRSHDGGLTWETHLSFPRAERTKIPKPSPEMSMAVTKKGTVVVAYMNYNEIMGWDWDNELHDTHSRAVIPQMVMRSTDGASTWIDLQTLHDDWTGEVRDMIELSSGRLVLSSMKMLHNPGRHSVVSYVSDDDGVTWRNAQTIDLGGVGHHGGVSEATITELADGRVWMLLRTNWGYFWQAFSHDGGLTWRDITPSTIATASSPGLLTRLTSGRLMLLWNRPYPEGETSFPLRGGDCNWSEVPVSNHRSELSMAFSEDEGKTFSDPVVIARIDDRNGYLAYPRTLEYRPGEVWVTTMQGGLHASFKEIDFI
ncbi:MAG: exo-alpha-sialidase [Lentisphaerae bacterium]|jgi:hypothetical protein|nr:exo-alpha-sialidase [Lentisphaerota bacterium]